MAGDADGPAIVTSESNRRAAGRDQASIPATTSPGGAVDVPWVIGPAEDGIFAFGQHPARCVGVSDAVNVRCVLAPT